MLIITILLVTILTVTISLGSSYNDKNIKINEVGFNQESNIDWIELYNPNFVNKSLKGFYLTDDINDLTKFEIEKDLVIESGGFLVIYGDEYEGDETNTVVTNFRIANNEIIHLVSPDGITSIDSFGVVDELNTLNNTLGRYPDGSEDIYLMSDFTLGSSNTINEKEEEGDIKYSEIFDSESVRTISIEVSEENLVEMSNYQSSNGRSSEGSEDPPYVVADLNFNGEEYSNIAIRYKGNSSLRQNSNKLPLRIDMNKYTDGQSLDGIEEFVLNPNYKDSSQIRETLSYEIMREEDFPSEYTSFVKVYINNEYIGIYTMVENVDEEFLERNFDNSDGILIKSSNSSTSFEYIDANPYSYSNSFDIKQGNDEDIQEFIEFLEFLNSDVDENYEEEILEQLDVYGTLDYFAMLVVQSSMDSYLYSGRNFYLYFDTSEEKYKFIPWDMNESFGVYMNESANLKWDVSDPTTSTNSREQSSNKPVFEQLMKIESFRTYYLEKVEYYSTEVVTLEKLETDIDKYSGMIETEEETLDTEGLKSFISERMDIIASQLEDINY